MSQSYEQAQEATRRTTTERGEKKRMRSALDETPRTGPTTESGTPTPTPTPQQVSLNVLSNLINQAPSVTRLAEIQERVDTARKAQEVKRRKTTEASYGEETTFSSEQKMEDEDLTSALLAEGFPLSGETSTTISNNVNIIPRRQPYYGPYTTSNARTFWQSETPPTTPLTKRLRETPKLIREGLKDLTPEFWGDVAGLLYGGAPQTGEDIEEKEEVPEGLGKKEQSEKQTESDHPVRRSTRGAALTGVAAGKEFVEKVVPRTIEGTTPEVELIEGAEKKHTAKGSPVRKDAPGYILNMPAYYSKSVDNILRRYEEQATRGAPDLASRLAAVIGINARMPLVEKDKSNVVNAVAGVSADTAFGYGIFGFLWAPQFILKEPFKPAKPTGTFQDVRTAYAGLPDAEARQYARDNLYKERGGQKHLAYGTFRETVAGHRFVQDFVELLGADCDPVYIHVGDPDAMTWVVNNDESVGILSRYDEIIGALSGPEGNQPRPPLIVGGYNFGVPTEQDEPIVALCKVGNILDRAIRRSIAAIVPETLYATEPNLLVKVLDKNEKGRARQWQAMRTLLAKHSLFGKADAEGNVLKLALAKVLNRSRSEQNFAPYVDATIETEIPERILESAASHPSKVLLNLIEQKQSYTTTKNWTGIARTGAEPKAKQYVEGELRDIIEELIENARKGRKQSAFSTTAGLGGTEPRHLGGFPFLPTGESSLTASFNVNFSPSSFNFNPNSSQSTFPETSLWATEEHEEEQDFRAVLAVAKQESFETEVEKSGLQTYVEIHNASDKGDNCLIYSIAGALNKNVTEEQIQNIRSTQKLDEGVLDNGYLTTFAIPDILRVLGAENAGGAIISTRQPGINGWFPAEFLNADGNQQMLLVNAAGIHFGWATLRSGVRAEQSVAPEMSETNDTGIQFSVS